MALEDVLVYATDHKCWKCRKKLVRLDPPCDGWELWCPACKMLTMREDQLRAAMADVEEGSLGLVAGVSKDLKVEWKDGKTP